MGSGDILCYNLYWKVKKKFFKMNYIVSIILIFKEILNTNRLRCFLLYILFRLYDHLEH